MSCCILFFIFLILFYSSCYFRILFIMFLFVYRVYFYFGSFIYHFFPIFIGLKAHFFGLNLDPIWPRTGPTTASQQPRPVIHATGARQAQACWPLSPAPTPRSHPFCFSCCWPAPQTLALLTFLPFQRGSHPRRQQAFVSFLPAHVERPLASFLFPAHAHLLFQFAFPRKPWPCPAVRAPCPLLPVSPYTMLPTWATSA